MSQVGATKCSGSCEWCGTAFERSTVGRPRRYCTDAHRQAACRFRKARRDIVHPTPELRQRLLREFAERPELRKCVRDAVSCAKRKEIERFGGRAAVEREERRAERTAA